MKIKKDNKKVLIKWSNKDGSQSFIVLKNKKNIDYFKKEERYFKSIGLIS